MLSDYGLTPFAEAVFDIHEGPNYRSVFIGIDSDTLLAALIILGSGVALIVVGISIYRNRRRK